VWHEDGWWDKGNPPAWWDKGTPAPSRYDAGLLLVVQRYTQSNGARPFGISLLIVGFDEGKAPKLYQTEPAGTYHEWKVRTSELVAQFRQPDDLGSCNCGGWGSR